MDLVELETIRGRQFANETVHLDGREFVQCSFVACTLVYSGGDPFIFEDSPLGNGCLLEFEGPAGNTLNALRALYAMGFGATIDDMLASIRRPFGSAVQ